MKLSLKNNQKGMAITMLIIVVVVVAAVGGAGYYVFKNKDSKSDSVMTAASKEIQDACNKLYDDEDLCKFSGSYTGKGPYVVAFTSTDKDGKTSTFTSSTDKDGNTSTVTLENGKEASAFISINGDNYVKDVSDGSWTKYPKSTETSTSTSSPTSDLKIDTTESTATEDKRIQYKKLGKEACGKDTCLKYQIIDPATPNAESIIWFGTKDYQLHKWSYKDDDGTSVGEFSYTSVTVSVPSPVKDAPAVPSQADIQRMIDAASGSTEPASDDVQDN